MSISTCPSEPVAPMDATDRAIVLATQAGLPLVPDPWSVVGKPLGITGDEVRTRMQRMQESGVIRRIAAVPNHYRLGYVANGMTVWDVDDADRKSTRLNSSHVRISYAVFCLKKKNNLKLEG